MLVVSITQVDLNLVVISELVCSYIFDLVVVIIELVVRACCEVNEVKIVVVPRVDNFDLFLRILEDFVIDLLIEVIVNF